MRNDQKEKRIAYFSGTVHAISSIAIVCRVPSACAILVHIDNDVRREVTEPLFDVACLLAHKLCVITIWIIVARQRALEVC